MERDDEERLAFSPGLVRPPDHGDAGMGNVGDTAWITYEALTRLGSAPAALQEARRLSGLSLERLADALQIRVVYLRAVEEGRFEDLPGPGYMRSIVARYALQVGLDPDLVVAKIKDEPITPTDNRHETEKPLPADKPEPPGPVDELAPPVTQPDMVASPAIPASGREQIDSDRGSEPRVSERSGGAAPVPPEWLAGWDLDALDKAAPATHTRSSLSRRRESRGVPRFWLLAGLLGAGLLAVIMIVLRMLGIGG